MSATERQFRRVICDKATQLGSTSAWAQRKDHQRNWYQKNWSESETSQITEPRRPGALQHSVEDAPWMAPQHHRTKATCSVCRCTSIKREHWKNSFHYSHVRYDVSSVYTLSRAQKKRKVIVRFPNRPHYGSCLSVSSSIRLFLRSVCCWLLTRERKATKNKVGVNVPQSWMTIFRSKGRI